MYTIKDNLSLFLRLTTNVESKRERERERASKRWLVHAEFWREISSLQRLAGISLTFDHGCFYKHIYSRLTILMRSGHQSIFLSAADTSTFRFWAFVRYFRSVISWSSHFSFQCVTTTWLIDLWTCHSSLFITLLATKAFVVLTKKIHFPIYQHCNSIKKEIHFLYWGFGLLSHDHVISCAISSLYRLKYPYGCFSSNFCILVFLMIAFFL